MNTRAPLSLPISHRNLTSLHRTAFLLMLGICLGCVVCICGCPAASEPLPAAVLLDDDDDIPDTSTTDEPSEIPTQPTDQLDTNPESEMSLRYEPLGQWMAPEESTILAIHLVNDLLLVQLDTPTPCAPDCRGRTLVLDIQDPSSPTLVQDLEYAISLCATGNRATGLRIAESQDWLVDAVGNVYTLHSGGIEFNGKAADSLLSHDTPAVIGNYAATLSGTPDGVLEIWDLSNASSSPTPGSPPYNTIVIPAAGQGVSPQIASAGSTMLLGSSRLWGADLSNPATPRVGPETSRGEGLPEGFDGAVEIAAGANRMFYVLDGPWGETQEIHAVRVNAQQVPLLVNSIELPNDLFGVYGMRVGSDYVFVNGNYSDLVYSIALDGSLSLLGEVQAGDGSSPFEDCTWDMRWPYVLFAQENSVYIGEITVAIAAVN